MRVGPERPTEQPQAGIYTGTAHACLKGKTALISRCQGGWNVQVDDRSTGFGLGWWRFGRKDWRPL